MELLKELCEASGIPGREKPIIDIMQRELKKSCDDVYIDGIGNVIGVKKGKSTHSKKIMIAAHMDEIGFVVSHIDKNGFIRFIPRGNHIPRVIISQRVKICGRNDIFGIVEGVPFFLSGKPEDRLTVPEIKDLYIDTGLGEKELKKEIQIGDIIVLDREFKTQGDVCISKGMDDRVGCFVMIEALKKIKAHDVEIYAVATVQEEVGCRGANRAARGIIPDIGIAVDICWALDTPDVPEHQQVTRLGEGVGIKINDILSISNYGVVEFLKKTAKKHRIKHQLEILPGGGTDASGMQLFGDGPVVTLSIPTRHFHTPNEMVHKNDVRSAVKLLCRLIECGHQCTPEF